MPVKHWVLKETSMQKLTIFERKKLRKIFGPTKESNGLWRIKTNEELDDLIQQQNVIRFVNLLKTERRPLYLKVQSVPRCKHLSSRL
jgi:hypothetical protein